MRFKVVGSGNPSIRIVKVPLMHPLQILELTILFWKQAVFNSLFQSCFKSREVSEVSERLKSKPVSWRDLLGNEAKGNQPVSV